jgi:hypothetical protein
MVFWHNLTLTVCPCTNVYFDFILCVHTILYVWLLTYGGLTLYIWPLTYVGLTLYIWPIGVAWAGWLPTDEGRDPDFFLSVHATRLWWAENQKQGLGYVWFYVYNLIHLFSFAWWSVTWSLECLENVLTEVYHQFLVQANLFAMRLCCKKELHNCILSWNVHKTWILLHSWISFWLFCIIMVICYYFIVTIKLLLFV